jgi:hypothetical protein
MLRTTIDIPNPLYRQLKGNAVSEGRSVRELVLRAVQLALHAPPWKSHAGQGSRYQIKALRRLDFGQ